jgi:CheY-like chemotaxis protein
LKGDEVLERLGDDPETAAIPVVVSTSQELDTRAACRLARRACAILQKRDLSVETLARPSKESGPARSPS